MLAPGDSSYFRSSRGAANRDGAGRAGAVGGHSATIGHAPTPLPILKEREEGDRCVIAAVCFYTQCHFTRVYSPLTLCGHRHPS